ncbi:succinate dehydrogenase assembly factor 2 [Marivibrio halodurans]|uniref:FAD assembly factor SdhE n=1 Tax=Marivibrio halodurans TaxID=2039722 RepID=A0A8J7RYV4_9PROT|nr:succinate dehydrogenase assembly factor 2 [Marivibrio halodurans]MBP5855554.1 succinate dehydrogenase assembly factor 2 [Marivibrio halodurans]
MDPVNDNSAGEREARRRKLMFRAWHRGTKEMDILLGGFAEAYIGEMTDEQLDAFEALLHIPDQDFYDMLVKDGPVPAAYDSPMMHAIIAYAGTRFEPS